MSNLFDIYKDNKEALAVLADKTSGRTGKAGASDNATLAKIEASPVTFLSGIENMVGKGLSYINGDYYVFIQKGGVLTIHPTPRGSKIILSNIAKDNGLTVIINEGTFNNGDEFTLESDGQFDEFKIRKNPDAMLAGNQIIASYAVVSVFKDSEKVAKKVFYVPSNEYQKIKAMASGSANYEMTFASKVVIKRVLAGIYLLLGVTLSQDEQAVMAMLDEANRVDLEDDVTTGGSSDYQTIDNDKEPSAIDCEKEATELIALMGSCESLQMLTAMKATVGNLFGNVSEATEEALKSAYNLSLENLKGK